MKTTIAILISIASLMFAVPGQAQDKNAAIERARLCIDTNARFMGEFPTVDGRQIHWIFSWGKLNDIPIVIDVPAFPTQPEIDIAESAAITEARSIYTWMHGSKTSEPK